MLAPGLFFTGLKLSKRSPKNAKQRNTMYPKVKAREGKHQDDEHGAVGLQLLESLSLDFPSSPEKEHQDASPIFIARFPKSPLRKVVTPTIYTHKEAEQNNKMIDEKEKPNARATFLTHDSTPLTDADKNNVRIDEKEKPNARATFLTDDSTPLTDADKNNVRIDEKEKPNARATFLTHDSTPLTDADENNVWIDEKEKPNTRATFRTYDYTSPDVDKNNVEIDEKIKPNIRASSILRPRAVLSSPNNDAVIGNRNGRKAERPAASRDHDVVQNSRAKSQCKASPTRIKSQVNTTFSNDVPDNKSDLKGKKGSAMAVSGQKRYLRTWKF